MRQDNLITDNKYYLVNTDVDFDRFNINLTGISPEMVANEPPFPII